MTNKTVKITTVAVMTAVATVFYFLLPEIPIIPGVDYMKIDLSDFPAILTGLVAGPWYGVLVGLFKNIFHLFKTTTFGVGEVMNVLVVCSIVLPLCFFSKKFSEKSGADALSTKPYLLSAVITVVISIICGWLINAVLTPIYFLLVGIPVTAKAVAVGVVGSTALNAVKSIINVGVFYPIYYAVKKRVKNI
mgnify:CR=1 FL=1